MSDNKSGEGAKGEGSSGGNSGTTAIPVEKFNELQSKFDNLYAKHTDLNKQLEGWNKLGSPDRLKGILEDYELMKRDKAAGNREEIDKLIKDAREEEQNAYKGKLTELEQSLQAATGKVREYSISTPAIQIASKLFVEGARDLVVGHLKSVSDLDGDNVVIKGSDGKPIRSKADPSKPMGIQEYLEGYAQSNPSIALPKGTGGTGGSTGTGSSATGGVTAEQYAAMSREDRAKLPQDVQRQLAPQALKLLSKVTR
jgi:uncharacterized protein YdcH (DUF465 family)